MDLRVSVVILLVLEVTARGYETKNIFSILVQFREIIEREESLTLEKLAFK